VVTADQHRVAFENGSFPSEVRQRDGLGEPVGEEISFMPVIFKVVYILTEGGSVCPLPDGRGSHAIQKCRALFRRPARSTHKLARRNLLVVVEESEKSRRGSTEQTAVTQAGDFPAGNAVSRQ